MSLHKFEYEFNRPEWGQIELDVDDDLDQVEKEDIAIREIKEVEGDDVRDINITAMIYG